jgi:putative addiction module component (TIGR02574 family)
MSITLESLGLDRLTRAERLELVQALWDSLTADASPPLSDRQRVELQRRAAEDEADPSAVVSWESVREEARARMRNG